LRVIKEVDWNSHHGQVTLLIDLWKSITHFQYLSKNNRMWIGGIGPRRGLRCKYIPNSGTDPPSLGISSSISIIRNPHVHVNLSSVPTVLVPVLDELLDRFRISDLANDGWPGIS